MTALHEEEVKLTQLWFFHPDVDSHKAQALLLQKHVSVGTFLVRHRANKRGYAVSVKAGDEDVKHFEMTWTGSTFEFGHGIYKCADDLEFHFRNKPLIGGESGQMLILEQPYPCQVMEPQGLYESVRFHGEGRISEVFHHQKDFSINNKAGFLTKIGAVFKTWKTRWFILNKNELKYFKDASHKTPIRVLDLNECMSCEVCDDPKLPRRNVFSLKFSWRTFLFSASSEQEMREWINVISWRLEHRTNEH